MRKSTINNAKLGIFVLAGLLFLILLLYMIGRNSNLFQATYILKARFNNTQGLVAGNNVRFSGIESGTVKKITILSDSVIEVTMVMDKDMQHIIRRNSLVSIGTEGLVGNKLVNIVPSPLPAMLAQEGDILQSEKSLDTDAMLRTLNKTNGDVALIAKELRLTIQRINDSSNGFWALLKDSSTPNNIKASALHIRSASGKAAQVVSKINDLVSGIQHGQGAMGVLLSDTAFAQSLSRTAKEIEIIGTEADSLTGEIRKVVAGIREDVNNGNGAANALLKDSILVKKLNTTLDHLEMGTKGFNQNMEALKHSFLFKGYFRRLAKKSRESGESTITLEQKIP